MHSIAGGVFPFPLSVTELVKRLPPPNAFEGPFVKIDEFIKRFQHIELVEDFQPCYVYINGEPIRELDHLNSMTSSLNLNMSNQTNKRSVIGSNSDDEDSKKTKSIEMDIYKQRQYKKLIDKK
jgi:hypothetical protein